MNYDKLCKELKLAIGPTIANALTKGQDRLVTNIVEKSIARGDPYSGAMAKVLTEVVAEHYGTDSLLVRHLQKSAGSAFDVRPFQVPSTINNYSGTKDNTIDSSGDDGRASFTPEDARRAMEGDIEARQKFMRQVKCSSDLPVGLGGRKPQ